MNVTPRLIGYQPHPFLLQGPTRAYVGQAAMVAAQLASTPEGQKLIGEASDAVLPIVTGILDEARNNAGAVVAKIKCALGPCKCAITGWSEAWKAITAVFEKEYNAAQDPISKWGIATALKAEMESPYWANIFAGKTRAPNQFGGSTKPCKWGNPPSVVWGAKVAGWIAANEGPMLLAMQEGKKPEHKPGGLPAWAPWAIGGAAALALGLAFMAKR
jgi:hypothetical protein